MINRTESTTRPTPTIVCPSWCQTPMQEHLDDLDGWEGRVIHQATRAGNGWTVDVASHTYIDGTPDEAPQVDVSGPQSEMSVADARALAEALLAGCRDLES